MRIGLVGCGRWGRLILRDLVRIGCTVTVVARSPASRQAAAEGGAEAVVEGVAGLAGVLGVVIATPTATHADMIDAVLPLSVPVFVEKPLTADPAAADSIAERAGDRVFVMDKWRYHPGVEEMARIARSGEFGSIRSITTRRLSWGQPHRDVDAVWILLPHDLCIVLEVVGHLPAALAAIGSFGPGEDAQITALLGPEPACHAEVSSLSPLQERRVTVLFEEAAVLLADSYDDALEIRRIDGAEVEARPIGQSMPLQRELEAFVDHLRGGPPPRSSAAEGALMVRRTAELRAMAGA